METLEIINNVNRLPKNIENHSLTKIILPLI